MIDKARSHKRIEKDREDNQERCIKRENWKNTGLTFAVKSKRLDFPAGLVVFSESDVVGLLHGSPKMSRSFDGN